MSAGRGRAPARGSKLRPAVTYWTGIWEPHREGISKEVAWLRRALDPHALVVSFTPQSTAFVHRDRVVRLNFRRWLLLRAAAVVLERAGTVSHVFGGVGAVAHFLHVLGRRPILVTAVIPGDPLERALYDRVAAFVVQSPGIADTLMSTGVSPDRIETIYPGLDLAEYPHYPPPATSRFQLLFASTPSDPDDFDARGIGMLIELARLRPDIDIVIPWRQWGDLSKARQSLEARQPPANFKVIPGDVADMGSMFAQVHATVCCFEAGHGKAAPNSIVEGLALRRPALLADTCGIAPLVAEWKAGVVTSRSAEALAAGVEQLQRTYDSCCQQARRLAADQFDGAKALRRYEHLYQRLAVGRY